MHIQLEDQIGEIVMRDYRTASVFKAKGIDFCCRGHRTLLDAINEKGLVAEDIMQELNKVDAKPKEAPFDYAGWKLEYLIDHIIDNHHAYIRQQIPVITSYLDQVFKAHGKKVPVIEEIRSLFIEDAQDLMKHLETEEEIVFPMIRDLAITPLYMDSPSCVPLTFFQKMISNMEQEHLNEGNRWRRINELTENFQLEFGCNVSHVAFSLLREFQDDLHLHIHIENNILFPGAIELKNNIKAIQS